MKKTLVALSVLAASVGSAQAFEIYNEGGVTVDMGGDIEVVYLQKTEKGHDFQQDIQDADVKFDVRYAVNDDLQFGGFFELQDTGTNEGDAYVALYSDSMGSIKVGRTCTALDDAGIGSDYQFGITTFFNGSDMYCGDEVIRWDFDQDNFYATAAIAQDKKDSTYVSVDGTYFDARVGYRVADFDFTLLGGTGEAEERTDMDSPVTGTHDETLLGAEARFNGVENLGLAAAIYTLDNEAVKTTTFGLSATYQLDKVALATGFSLSSDDVDANDDINTWYVNAGYPIAPNTTAYAEVGGNSKDDSQTGVAVGVKASF